MRAEKAPNTSLLQVVSQEEAPLEIDFSRESILRIVALVYPEVNEAFLEVIQNAIDAGAKNVWARICLKGKDRYIVVTDDGKGCSREEMRLKLMQIGKGNKVDDPNYVNPLGKYGVGLISFYQKAEMYSFTSGPRHNRGRVSWEGYRTYDFANITSVSGRLNVHSEPVPSLSERIPEWSTKVEVRGLTASRIYMRLSRLMDDIRDRFGGAMRRHGTTVHIELTDSAGKLHKGVVLPDEFTGEPFDPFPWRKTSTGCGLVTMEMRRVTGSPTGRVYVQVMGSDFRLPWSSIAVQAEGLMDKKVIEDLGSGYLEGVIIVEKCKFRPDRQGMESNDSFVEMLSLIDSWVRRYARSHLDQVRTRMEHELEREVGTQVLQQFQMIHQLDPDALGDLLMNVPGIRIRRIEETEEGEDINVDVAPTGSDTDGPTKRTGTKRRRRGGTKKENLRTAIVVQGEGTVDEHIIDRKTRLSMAFEDMAGSSQRFKVDQGRGVFVINKRHPDYLRCYSNRAWLEQYVYQAMQYALCDQTLSSELQARCTARQDKYFELELLKIMNSGLK